MTDLTRLLGEPRIKLVADLEPIAGTRFQPTGFPDLGPATYASPADGRRLLLVESAQSMANRLEGRLWNASSDEPIEAIRGLPYVRVFDAGGEYLTSSRTESHRLASAYVKAARFGEKTGWLLVREQFGLQEGRPIDHSRFVREVFQLDPLCLLHGVFFAAKKGEEYGQPKGFQPWPGQPKIARAVTAFVEAAGVQEAYSGGVKFDHVSNSGDKEAGKAAEQGYGNVPFPRTEFVAESIEASFVVDVSQIRRYALEDRERELLLALALYEIRSLLDEGLRLRTACDLAVGTIRGDRPTGFELPDLGTLEGAIGERITEQKPPLDGIYGG